VRREGQKIGENGTTVRVGDAKHQTAEKAEQGNPSGEAATGPVAGEAEPVTDGNGRSGTEHLMEEVLGRDNVKAALKRVMQNKGSPGVDGMKTDALPGWLEQNWRRVSEQLLKGTYRPAPVRRHDIPKSDGGTRTLGIPTVLDRLIQQSILQVLQARIDPTFSEHSYGFRPGRSAHDALRAAVGYIEEGRRWVVDVDIEKFFDRVNHDVLMGRLAKRIADKRMLKLIREYLNAGIMADGVVMARDSGTPQGGPLSPLLANILLDEVDKELEKRGHRFVRYADDCNVYVQSRKAGERVLEGLRELYGKLRLRVNEGKSAVAPVNERHFLGHGFVLTTKGEVRLSVAPKALEAFRTRARVLTGRARGWSFMSVIEVLAQYVRGWRQYFRYAMHPSYDRVDGWLRRRLRALQLKLWKTPKAITRAMRRAGVPDDLAQQVNGHRRRYWAMAKHHGMHRVLSNADFDGMGLPRLAAERTSI
jgi:RNA-directed DNA polymerase